MRNYLLKSSEALPKSQGGVFAKKNTIRATLHPTLHTLPRAARYAATLLLLLCLGVGNAWGTEYTFINQSNGKYTGDFYTGRAESNVKSDAKTVNGLSCTYYVAMASTGSPGVVNTDRYIKYDVKTTATQIIVYFYTSSGSNRSIKLGEIKEGNTSFETIREKTIKNTGDTLIYNTTNTTNSTIYITVPSNAGDIRFYQVKAIESGSALLKAGEGGYELNLNQGRVSVKSGETTKIDGITIATPSSGYTAASTEALTVPKSVGGYLMFTTPASPGKLKLTYSGGQMAYNSSASSAGATNLTSGTEYTLSGNTTYYLVNTSGSGTSLTKIQFVEVVAKDYTVTAATSTGTDTYGTVAAAASSLDEGETTTITATPATGYQVTNWAVSGTGASISPSGASNSNTTTLTMGTANATVTATFSKVYASGTYTFDGNSSLGTAPNNKTCGTGTSSDFRIDNIFFSGATWEYDNTHSGGSGDGNNFDGWKWKTENATIKFFVEDDSDVTIGIGSIGDKGGVTVTYTDPEGTAHNNTSLTAATNNEIDVKGGTMVTITHNSSTKTVTLKKIIIEAQASCTAPNHVDITPTTEDGNYGWRYTTGETLKLTATPYSSAGTGSPITSGITGYQWQKYVESTWTDLEDDTNISGATTANLQISNLTTSNGGSYRCNISTGATCTTSSDGYFVRIFTLYGGYSGGSYSNQPIVWTGEKRGTVTVNLNASSSYKFKFTDNNGRWFGNGGTISKDFATEDDGTWGFGTSAGDATLSTGSYGGGDYVLTVDITHFDDGGSKYVNLRSVVYPKKTTYLQLCSDWKAATAKYAIYYWKGDDNGWTDFMETHDCDGDIRYADIPVWATDAFFVRFNPSKESTGNFDSEWNRSGDNESTLPTDGKDYYNSLSVGGNGKYYGSWGTYSPTTYTISFAGNGSDGGSMSNISSIACDADQALTANSFEKTGHNFSCWHANVDVKVGGATVTAGSTIADEATIEDIRSNITLTAQWTPKTYSISLNGNGGSGNTSSVTATYNSATLSSSITNPTYSGHTFLGWYSGEGGTGNLVIDVNGVLQANVTSYTGAGGIWTKESGTTLYAKWEENCYSFTPSGDNGTIAVGNTVSGSTGGTMKVATAKIVKTDDNRLRFDHDGDAKGSVLVTLNNYMQAGTIISLSIYNPDDKKSRGLILKDMNGTTVSTCKHSTAGVKHYLYTVVADDGLEGEYRFVLKRSESAELVALSVAYCGADRYTVTYKANGGTGDDVVNPTATTVASNSFTAPTGYHFNGWNTDNEGGGTAYAVGATVDDNLTLYAQWTANQYDINYYDGGATDNIAFSGSHADGYPTKHTYGSETTLKSATKTGYTFGGWFDNYSCTDDAVTSIGATALTSNTKLYAKWTINSHTLTWNFNGGSSNETAGDDYTAGGLINYGTTINYPSNGSMSRSGYVFNGWSTDASTMPDENLTITAQWTRVYTVTYAYNGATGGNGTASATAASVTLPTPTKTSYTFDGWYNTAGTKVGDGGDSYSPTADIMLYARWQSACAGGGGSTTIISYTMTTECKGSDPCSETASGSIGGTAYLFKLASNNDAYKLNNDAADSKPASYFSLKLSSGYYQAGDVLTLDGSKAMDVYTGAHGSGSELGVTSAPSDGVISYTLPNTLPNNTNEIYVYRSSSTYNGTLTYMTVTRSGSGTCYHVFYHGNGAESGFISDPGAYANSATPTVLAYNAGSYPLVKDGYTFQGWATSAEGSVAKTAGQTVTISSADVHLYAVWAETPSGYTVTATATRNMTGTFTGSTTITNSPVTDIESGTSVSYSNNTFTIDETTVTAPATIAGTVYVEAESDYVGGCTWRFDQWNNLPATVTADVDDVEAEYIPTFGITYNTNGGTINAGQVDWYEYTGSSSNEVTLPTNVTKDGYTFVKWMQDCSEWSGEDVERSVITCDNYGNFSLYAVWTPNNYTITYNLNGASWASSAGVAEYTVGTGATLPLAGAMTNVGYTFDGWYANSDLSTGGVVTSISTSDYGDKEYWAKWTEVSYTITYDANNGSATGSTAATEGHYVTVASCGFELDGYLFTGWNTESNGTGESYGAGEDIELTANMTLYAQWAEDYIITWGNVQIGGAGATVTPNVGGGNYTITANTGSWTGSLDASMVSSETSGVSITNVVVDNSGSPKTITVTFAVGAEVVGESIGLTLSVPAAGVYGAKESTKAITIDRCTGSGGGSDGVLFSAEFKDSGLGTSDICTAANTPYTFTTAELKAAPTGGSIKAFSTSNLSHMKFATKAISIAGSDGVIQIDLDNPIATNDLFTYLNVNSSTSSAYLRHTSPTTTTDQIALTVYNSKEAKVRLTSGFNGETTLYIVRNSSDFKLHKAAVVRPAFLMLLRDDTPTSDTNLSGTDVSLTTENYLAVISGGSATFTSPSSGNLKIKRSSSKNYINFNNAAGYVKIVLNDALQEGDVIGFDSYNTNNLALTTTATRSTSIVTTNQLYTVDASSDLKGKSTFYLWQNSGSSDFLRGLQIARSGVAGGGGGTDKITTTLTWDTDLTGGVAAETGDADFTHTVTQDKNSLGAITYSSSNTSVATVNASGKVHIAGAGNATITATMAASGCYKEATVSYNITVTDNCADVAGTISTEDLGCSGVRLTVTGHTAAAGVEYQWYKDGGAIGGATSDNYTATTAGEYYVVVTNTGAGHCEKASTNTITLEDSEAATASKIVNSWYVKNGRRTPDIALVQTENATDFTVTSGGSPITTFAGCAFYLGTDGIIYLKGQQEDGSAPTGLTSGDETLKFTATACGGNSSELSITIHKQESTTRPSVAFVVDGTKGGDFDEEEENHSVNTELYQYLDYGADRTGAFDLTGQNVYSTVDEQAIREHYSQFDAILITDDPSTDTKSGKKSYVDAFGTMIDVRPILTMEAFVSKWGNWKAKGIDGNPESPNPRQYKMKLQCKDHAIFKELSVGTNVETETIDGVEYWTVTMVDNTKSPYSGVADGTDTDTKPALQGFSADDVSSLLLLGEISGGSLYAGVERQEETAARLMLLGLNAKALPNALTPEGKKVIENALKYLIETDLEKVDDCSNYFTGKTSTDWNTDSNWSKNHVPNSPNVRVRILSECVINSGTYKVAEVDIATSGKSLNKAGEMTGKLTINADAALIVGGKIRTAEAPYFNTGDLMPTTEEDLVINTSSTAQAALIFNNDAGDTKATVNLYSLGRNDGSYQFQYMAIPMSYVPVNPSFAGAGIYTYVWQESSNGWERRGYYTDLYAFEGVGITTTAATASNYQMKGSLAPTTTKEIALTRDNKGLNLVGNSWTAPIQISKLSEDNTDDNIEKVVYIYSTGYDAEDGAMSGGTETAGQWLAIPFNAAGFEAWGGLKVIPSMQAFQVKVKEGGATLTLDYDKVVRGDNQALNAYLRAPKRTTEPSDIVLTRLRVADTKTHTDLYLFEGEQFSDAYDNGWEANFRAGDGRSAMLYARTAAGVMAVAALPELEGTQVFFIPGKETEYTFTFTGGDDTYYLNDIKEQKSTLINEANSYTFRYESGDAANRFIISRTPFEAPSVTTGITDLDAETPKAIKVIYNDKLYIIRGGRVYSADGSLVK